MNEIGWILEESRQIIVIVRFYIIVHFIALVTTWGIELHYNLLIGTVVQQQQQ